jgi:von Willebrand factor type A domain
MDAMDARAAFALWISQEKYQHRGAREIQALVRVTSSAGPGAGEPHAAGGALHGDAARGRARAAEVIIMDCSGSMANPVTKLHAARRAVCAALDAMRDGVDFAVLNGRYDAQVVYPRERALIRATPQTRAEAKDRVEQLDADDGTRISSWLALAEELLSPHAGAVRHAMLFTDGKNEHESRDGTLNNVLATCHGTFTCDARGIGDGWEPEDLMRIVSVLQGKADGLPDAADLEDDFRAVMREAMRKAIPDVAVRLRPRPGVEVRAIRQIYPSDADLTEHGVPVDATAIDYWTGSWSEETRDFLLDLTAVPDDLPQHKDVRLARVELTIRRADAAPPEVVAGPEFVLAHWTPEPPTRTRFLLESYARQREVGEAIRTGCRAWLAGDLVLARKSWGTAVRRASAAGDDEPLRLLKPLVEILDPVAGVVALRESIDRANVLRAEVRSVTTTFAPSVVSPDEVLRLAGVSQPDGTEGGSPLKCPAPGCDRVSPPGAQYCEKCGHPLGAAGQAGAGDHAGES